LTLSGAVSISLSAYARITSIRANIVGPWRSAISCGLPFVGVVFCLGQFGDVFCGIAERDQVLAR
jgi:hypothetical protein